MKSLDFTRADRLQDQIKRELSQIINNKVKDPRLYGLTLTRVELSEDKKQAYVYFSSFNSFNNVSEEDLQEGLVKAKGFIRGVLSSNLRLKYTPDLIFSPEIDILEN
ncbi:MAG: 30S ribosome-binding factor RbfA [SAR86 cluster bacterium]|jgi:ribosome-binding factor A|nr:30S ribosome-binding factor RbfA [SAR86 cluster bacterium]|tara:strand:- start:7550 stop:7870 length:321 start_codon:yes stop_codon:yes gene_type:complete